MGSIARTIANSIKTDGTLDSDASNSVNFRNLIMNGDMSIAQRGTSATGKTDTGYYTTDRWNILIDNIGTWSISQSTVVPSGQGFSKSYKLDCTTADASPASGDQLQFRQYIEGQMVQHLKKGTSNAESITLSFWVRSAKIGTYIIEIRDNDNDRNINKSYTINSADTWEKKTLTFEGDTSGTLDNDNNLSLQISWWLAAGSSLTSGTLATSWESRTNANRAVGQVNLADSTSNDWYITGVQLEVGTTASDFEFLPYDVNLQRCQRYYYKQADASGGTNQIICVGCYETSGVIFGVIDFPVTMRTGPSNVSASGTNYYNFLRNGSDDNFDSLSNALGSPKTAGFFSAQGSGTAGDAGTIRTNNTNAYVAFDAEF